MFVTQTERIRRNASRGLAVIMRLESVRLSCLTSKRAPPSSKSSGTPVQSGGELILFVTNMITSFMASTHISITKYKMDSSSGVRLPPFSSWPETRFSNIFLPNRRRSTEVTSVVIFVIATMRQILSPSFSYVTLNLPSLNSNRSIGFDNISSRPLRSRTISTATASKRNRNETTIPANTSFRFRQHDLCPFGFATF